VHQKAERSTDRATQGLVKLLQSHRYPIHSRLPSERALCKLLQVSRTTLRNGLDQMAQEGRIWRHVGKGTFVGGRPQSVHSCAEALGCGTTLSELLEARMLIEPLVARLAALRTEPYELKLMRDYNMSAQQAEDWASWDKWDELFHRAIAEASGNGLMINAIDQIFRIKKKTPWAITRAKKFDPSLRDRYCFHHLALISAIENHDLQEAERAMISHVREISATVGPATTGSYRSSV
jgi:DNA-binding FadR family transcriptional regulator